MYLTLWKHIKTYSDNEFFAAGELLITNGWKDDISFFPSLQKNFRAGKSKMDALKIVPSRENPFGWSGGQISEREGRIVLNYY